MLSPGRHPTHNPPAHAGRLSAVGRITADRLAWCVKHVGSDKGGEGAGRPTWPQLADMWNAETGDAVSAKALNKQWNDAKGGPAAKAAKAATDKARSKAKKG